MNTPQDDLNAKADKYLDFLVDSLVNGKRFSGSYEDIFRQLKENDYMTFTMVSLADALINAPENTAIWRDDFSQSTPFYTSSIKVTGWTDRDARVVVYAHTDHYLSNAENLRDINAKNKHDENNAAYLPHRRFMTLIGMDEAKDELGNRIVWVLDYDNKVKRHKFGSMHVDEAAEHPSIIGTLGGKERAEKYLERYEKHFGSRIIVPEPTSFHHYPIGYFMGVGANGNIMDYLSPINSKLAELIGLNGKSRPNSWEIINLALKTFHDSSNSDSLHDFGKALGLIYRDTAKKGYGEKDTDNPAKPNSHKPTEPNMIFYKEARPSLNQVLSLADQFLFHDRNANNIFKSRLSQLYKPGAE